jgi:hypothetical protein
MGLAAYVAAIDSLLLVMKRHRGQPYCSMSEGFGDALRHPIKRWPVIAVWSFLTVHLFGNSLPIPEPVRRLDPLGAISRLISPEERVNND